MSSTPRVDGPPAPAARGARFYLVLLAIIFVPFVVLTTIGALVGDAVVLIALMLVGALVSVVGAITWDLTARRRRS